MVKKYKTYSAEFKAKVVKELIKEEKTLAELSSEYKIPTKTIQYWQAQFIDGIDAIFKKGNMEKKHNEKIKEKDKEIDNAHKEIGNLLLQVNWLKKKCREAGLEYEKRDD